MHLHEEILLLVLKDDSGKTDWKAGMFLFVMAGALIAELLMEERIVLSDDKKKLVRVRKPGPHDDPVLNEALALIDKAKKERNVQHWVTKLASLKNLKENTAKRLCEQGVLKEETGKLLFIFTIKKYPELNPEPERQLIERLRQTIFSEGDVDVRTGLLISLTHQSGILAIPFSGKELRRQKKRIKAITSGELIGEATGIAITAIQSAATIAAVMPAITAAACPPSAGC